MWQYSVTTNDDQQVAVTVKAQSAVAGQYPIVASVHWGKTTIESIGPNQNNPTQELYASVSQGQINIRTLQNVFSDLYAKCLKIMSKHTEWIE